MIKNRIVVIEKSTNKNRTFVLFNYAIGVDIYRK